MSRISIDVTPEEHKKLKALAALQGKSIKEFVLENTLGARRGDTVDRDLADLEAFLDERIRDARGGAISARSIGEVSRQAHPGSAT